MTDILLLLGVALCAISLPLAVIALVQTQPPRGAAIVFVLGIIVMFAGAWMDQRPFGLESFKQSWERVVGGGDAADSPISTPAPAADPAVTAPATGTTTGTTTGTSTGTPSGQ
ncbi:hypothetical protein [Paracoccus pacificus]|uniref:Uncharacterized protein n=1 Tax=Paracoccus pacificus TaxID=1463598 RepID=A0ABW4R2M2_9RHOB